MIEFSPIAPVKIELPNSESPRRRRMVIVANPGATPNETIGPMEFLDEVNWVLNATGQTSYGYDIEMVGSSAGSVITTNGMTVSVAKRYDEVEGEIDTLIFPPTDYKLSCLQDADFLDWVHEQSGKARRVASVCIGTYVLAEAGLLNGRRATTHWAAQTDFQSRYPAINLDVDPIYVKDGKYYTSAGATSGFDMTLALIEEDFGRELALRVAQGMVMYLQRPGSQSQFSTHLQLQFEGDERLRDIQLYIAQNLGADLGVETLASMANMSARNFARLFQQQTGYPPGKYVEFVRLEAARQRLEKSSESLKQIARNCGFRSLDGMRALFDRHLGVTPRAYRDRFATANRSRQMPLEPIEI